MAASEVTSFETNFFRIVGTSETDTSAECLLAIGEDKKCKVFGVTSIKYRTYYLKFLLKVEHHACWIISTFQIIGHFRVVFCLCVKMSLCAKHL